MKLLKILKIPRLSKKIWVTIFLLLIAGTGFYFWPKPKEEPIQTIVIEKGSVKSTISASGSLEGTDSAQLRFKIGGKLNYLGVKPGEKVQKGKLIASLDTRDLQINLQQANNIFIAKEGTAKRVEDEVKDNENDENFTQKETRKTAQTARDNAYDDIKAAQRALEDAYIYAPISGIITKADFNPGQIITVSDVIADIVDETEYVFEAEVDEADLGKVNALQNAEITLNTYPDQIFNAKVASIRPITQITDSGATVVIVKLALGKPDINFVSGINGQAEIIINQVENVLVLPLDALIEENEIYIEKNGTYKKIKIETGLRSDTEVEVKSGLEAGDKVVITPSLVKIKSGKNFIFF